MKPLDTLFTILLSLGALQGSIYGVLLWKNNGINRTSNRFLAAILFFFSYRLIVELLKIFGFGNYDWLYHIFLEYNWIYGALIYLFVKAYITPNYQFKFKNEWLHFLPVIIEFAWSNFIKTQNFFWDGTRESLTWLGYWGYVVWMHYPTQFVITTALIIFYTSKSTNLIDDVTSNENYIEEGSLKWVENVLNIMKYFSLIVLVIVMSDFLFLDYAFTKVYEYPIFIVMAAITYWLGLEGFSKKDVSVIKLSAVITDKDQEIYKKLAEQLSTKMEHAKLYKDPELSLNSLAESLNVKPYLLSKCLNLHFDKKFNDYINSYRIEELKSLLQDEKNDNLTLLSLAFEAGFNSKASFNRAVKKITGKSPSELKESLN
ncbi:MAG: helix-turn-helix transcriptional regulator [Bacteroidota bacterium]